MQATIIGTEYQIAMGKIYTLCNYLASIVNKLLPVMSTREPTSQSACRRANVAAGMIDAKRTNFVEDFFTSQIRTKAQFDIALSNSDSQFVGMVR